MSSNFDSAQERKPSSLNAPGEASIANECIELLSAYLDGEVSVSERQQVQAWLDHDPKIHQLYTRMLRLRQGLQSMPIPVPTENQAERVQQILGRLDRRHQWRRLALCSGGAIAALFVGMISGTLPNPTSANNQAAITPPAKAELLMIALNQPVIEIPTALSTSRPIEQ